MKSILIVAALAGLALPSLAQRKSPDAVPEKTRVHVMSTPTGGEVYVDGKFRGSAPSDILLSPGDHFVKVVLRHKEWTRTVEITGGEISIQADFADEKDSSSIDTQETKPAGSPFGASQPAVDSLREMARKMRECRMRSVVYEHKWGKKATDTEKIWSGPPSNVTWDVIRSESVARSPYSGYLQFAWPADIDVPAESYGEWSKKEGLKEERLRKMFSLEYRYEFDVGPSGLELLRVLTRNEGKTKWEGENYVPSLPTCTTTPKKSQQPVTDSQPAPK